MRNDLLAHFVRSLHLRKDAPMPSELRESHERVNLIRKCSQPNLGAKVLQFRGTKKER